MAASGPSLAASALAWGLEAVRLGGEPFVANQYLQFHGNTEALGLLPLTLSLLAFVHGWRRGGVTWFALPGAFDPHGASLTTTAVSRAGLLVGK